MKYEEVEGDLIKLATEGKFDVIAHGCNCFCTMGAGIAPQMAYHFAANKFAGEDEARRGDINKLGTISRGITYTKGGQEPRAYSVSKVNQLWESQGWKRLYVVNCYSQYGLGANHKEGTSHPLSYPALILCLQKINHTYPGKHIGLPLIGCGLANGSWEDVKGLIQKNLIDMDVTIVHFKPEENENIHI